MNNCDSCKERYKPEYLVWAEDLSFLWCKTCVDIRRAAEEYGRIFNVEIVFEE